MASSDLPVRAPVLGAADEEDDGQDDQPQPEQGPQGGGDPRGARLMDVPVGDETATECRHTDDRHPDGARQARVETAGEGLLQVDATIGLLGQEGPGQAVKDQPDTGEEREHHPHATHQGGVQVEAVGHATGHARDPALVGAHEARAAQGVEEAVSRTALRPGLGAAVLLEGGRGARLRAVRRTLPGIALGAVSILCVGRGEGCGGVRGIGTGGGTTVRRGGGLVVHVNNSSRPWPAARSGEPLNDPGLSPQSPGGPSDQRP